MTDVPGSARSTPAFPTVPIGLLGIALLGIAACEETEVETTTRNLDRGCDVALLCAVPIADDPDGASWAGVPMDRCDEEGDAAANLFALVLQSTRGRLAAVNLTSGRLLDLDRRVPLHSSLDVGPLANALAVSPDGALVVVANLGDPRPDQDPTNPEGLPFLSVITPSDLLRDVARDPARVPLDAPAADIVFLDDRRVVVSQPALSQITFVALAEPFAASSRRELVLDPFPLLGPDGEPLEPISRPWALLVDPVRRRLLVGDRGTGRVAEIEWDGADALTVRRAIDLPGPAVAFSIEPPEGESPDLVAGRWVYVADGRSGGVSVLDAESLAPIDISAYDPYEWRSQIVFDGLARDVVLARVALPDPAGRLPDPARLHGVFAFLVSSAGNLYVADVEDRHNPACWRSGTAGEGAYDEAACPRHVLRSAVADADGPAWSAPPALYQAEDARVRFEGRPPPEFPRPSGWDDTVDDRDTYGVRFDPNRRRAVDQTWTLTYEGEIPWADGNGGNVEGDGWLQDRAVPFCRRGVLDGDSLVVLDPPSPIDDRTDCDAWEFGADAVGLEYRIAEAYGDRLRLETVRDGAPLPTEECFPFAVRYRIRAAGQWIVRGTSSGFQHHVVEGAGGRCVEDPADCPLPSNCSDDPPDPRCLHVGRAHEGRLFRNPFLCFTIESGSSPTPSGLRYEYAATGGFAALSLDVGRLPVAAAADATRRSGPALLVIDSSSYGLSRVDLDGFGITDSWE
jgi:hypothetical protein